MENKFLRSRFLLIHGNSLAYKSYYSLASLPPDLEQRESVVSLFTKIIMKLLKEYDPEYCAVVFDESAPAKIKKATFIIISQFVTDKFSLALLTGE